MQLSFNRCGVVPCIQDGPARAASRTPLAPTTGAYSEARSELNSPTGTKLTTMHWNAEGVHREYIGNTEGIYREYPGNTEGIKG